MHTRNLLYWKRKSLKPKLLSEKMKMVKSCLQNLWHQRSYRRKRHKNHTINQQKRDLGDRRRHRLNQLQVKHRSFTTCPNGLERKPQLLKNGWWYTKQSPRQRNNAAAAMERCKTDSATAITINVKH